MKNKFLAAALFALFTLTAAHAQEVEIKRDKVVLDGKEILRYEKENMFSQSFFSLSDDEELIHYRYSDNETGQYHEDDYFILNFLTQKVKIESTETHRATVLMSSKKSSEKLIRWLLKDKVLNTDGTINPDKLANFYQKYNEDITRRTVR